MAEKKSSGKIAVKKPAAGAKRAAKETAKAAKPAVAAKKPAAARPKTGEKPVAAKKPAAKTPVVVKTAVKKPAAAGKNPAVKKPAMAEKKPAVKKAPVPEKKPAVKKPAAVGKQPSAKPAAGKKPFDIVPPSGFPASGSAIPERIVDLLETLDNPELAGKQWMRAAGTIIGSIDLKTFPDFLEALPWDSPAGKDVLKRLGILKKGGLPARPGRDALAAGMKSGGCDPATVRELLECLRDCLCCCHCWPCRPWRFCRICIRHRVLVGQGNGSFSWARKLDFLGPTVSVDSMQKASINYAAVPGGVYVPIAHETSAAAHPNVFAPKAYDKNKCSGYASIKAVDLPNSKATIDNSPESGTPAPIVVSLDGHGHNYATPHNHPYAPLTHGPATSTGYSSITAVDAVGAKATIRNSDAAGAGTSVDLSLATHAHDYAPVHSHPYAPDTHPGDVGAHPGLFAPKTYSPAATVGYATIKTVDAANHAAAISNSPDGLGDLKATVSLAGHKHDADYAPISGSANYAAAGHAHPKYRLDLSVTDSSDAPNANMAIQAGGWIKYKAVKKSLSGAGPFTVGVRSYAERKDRADFKDMILEDSETLFESDGTEDWLAIRLKLVRSDGILVTRGDPSWDASVSTGYYLKLKLSVVEI